MRNNLITPSTATHKPAQYIALWGVPPWTFSGMGGFIARSQREAALKAARAGRSAVVAGKKKQVKVWLEGIGQVR